MPPTRPDPDGPIALIARQAGTATAFTPLLDALEASGERLIIGALGHARTTWGDRASIAADTFADLVGPLSQAERPSLLVTGTSAEPEDDALSWRWARQHGIPSIAFVDSWINYAARFTATEGSWVSPLPDVIAVLDEASLRRMVELGLPEARLRVVGSPAFDALMARKRAMGPRAEGLELLFASQPLAGRGLPASWDEHAALDLVIQTLQSMRFDGPVTLVLRRHPAEPEGVFTRRLQEPVSGSLRLRVDDRADRLDAIASAHAVIGIVSMIQVEAQWLGRPALSVQPGEPARSDLLSLHQVPIASDTASLKRAITAALQESWQGPKAPKLALPSWLEMMEELRRSLPPEY